MTYSTMLREWKDLSAARAINQFAYTPAGVLSMQTAADGLTGIIDLAPLDTLSAATREHERRRLVEDMKMIGIHILATATDERGTTHYRVRLERSAHVG